MVAQNYRFRRQSRALQELVSAGALGRLLGVRIACRRDLRNAWISPRDWRGKMAHPYLLDMAIHHVDMLRQITGREIAAGRRARVEGAGLAVSQRAAVEALLTLEDGTPVAYEGTWAATAPQTSWNGDWELVGEKARATWTGGVDDALRGAVHLQRYGSKRGAGGAAEARRGRPARGAARASPCRRRGDAARDVGRGQPARASPRSSRSRARSTSAGRSGREDRALPRALPRPHARGGARRRAGGAGARRSRSRRPGRTGRTRGGGRAHAASRSRRSPATATRSTPTRRSPLRPTRASARRCGSRAELGVGTVITFSGCPGESERSLRPSWVTCSWPDDYPGDARVAVGRARAPVLGRGGGVRARARRARRDRAASGLRRLQHGDDAAPARGGRRERRRRTSTRRTCSGSRSTRSPRRARSTARSSTCTPRTRASSRSGSRATASSRRGPTRTSAPGSSGRSATAIRSSSGASSRPRCATPGYDGALSIEHEDPLRSREDGLARAVATLREALA